MSPLSESRHCWLTVVSRRLACVPPQLCTVWPEPRSKGVQTRSRSMDACKHYTNRHTCIQVRRRINKPTSLFLKLCGFCSLILSSITTSSTAWKHVLSLPSVVLLCYRPDRWLLHIWDLRGSVYFVWDVIVRQFLKDLLKTTCTEEGLFFYIYLNDFSHLCCMAIGKHLLFGLSFSSFAHFVQQCTCSIFSN